MPSAATQLGLSVRSRQRRRGKRCGGASPANRCAAVTSVFSFYCDAKCSHTAGVVSPQPSAQARKKVWRSEPCKSNRGCDERVQLLLRCQVQPRSWCCQSAAVSAGEEKGVAERALQIV